MAYEYSTLKKFSIPLLAIVLIAGLFAAWRASLNDELPDWAKPAPNPPSIEERQRGGVVRVAVLTPPELADTGAGGATLRQLTLPRLFDAHPDGTWRASLVEPGSDRASKDGKTAKFKLRNANWSDGTPITKDDLARTADPRFVDEVEGPDSNGTITVQLTQKLPSWRNLWSSISPPREGLTSGLFNIKTLTSGLETVLVRNDNAYAHSPFLDELHLVVVSSDDTARQLMASGQIDVFAPPADTARIPAAKQLDGVDVAVAEKSGAWTALRFGSTLTDAQRVALANSIPRKQFVDALLTDEASSFDGFESSVWRNHDATSTRLDDKQVKILMPGEEPLHTQFARSVEHAVEQSGGDATIEDRATSDVQRALTDGTFDLLFDAGQTGPQICWLCTFSKVDDTLARKADEGDTLAAEQLQAKARDSGVFLPLWQPKTVVTSRKAAVDGVVANGFTSSVAWNADTWWQPR